VTEGVPRGQGELHFARGKEEEEEVVVAAAEWA